MWFNDIDIELHLRTLGNAPDEPSPSRHGLARARYGARLRASRLAERLPRAAPLPPAAGPGTARVLRGSVEAMASLLRLALPRRRA